MSYMISGLAIENLDNELNEIRIRSLKHIEGKIFRAFQQSASIEFNAGKLVSKLISWFNKKPLIEIETVLNLILTILKSEHVHETIKFLKKPRLEKEVNKIYELVKSTSVYKEIVINIKKILENYEEANNYNDISITSDALSSCSDTVSIQNLISDDDDFLAEYEEPWSTPCSSDVTYLNMLFNSTSTISTFAEIKNGLLFFKTAVDDYPAEYFLQPPYIFKNLIKLYFKEQSFTKLLISNFTFLCKAIFCRIQKRVTSECYDSTWKDSISNKPKIQITISRFCIEIFKLCVEHLKNFSETIDQNEVFYAYQLIMIIFDIMNLNEYKKIASVSSFKSILIDLGILAKFYRLEKIYRTYRIQYILIVSIIAKLVKELNLNPKANNIYSSFYQNISSRSTKTADIWFLELQYAILDYPLRNLYPEIYHEIEETIEMDLIENSQIKAILNCKDLFKPAIEILKQPEQKLDEQFIFLGYQAIETLSIHKSLTLVQKLIEVISNSMYLFDGNIKLKSTSEDLILRLLAHQNVNVKRTTYKKISNHMKQSFGALMNGNNNIKNMNSQFERPKSLGFPLTSDIITELICFGMVHDDVVIRKNAEIILSLILKGKDVLGITWKNILHILIPNFPLLQCFATYENNLGKLILELFDPENGLEAYELIKGNLRFLFSCEEAIRSEAILRLSYILSNDKSNEEYLPNVHEIFDIIPNNLCYLQVPRDPEKIFYGGLYDCTTVPALLELLKSSDVEPSIRKTCLMQLNVLCQDIDLNKMIFNENGWFLTIEALENSLKKNPTADYPDSVIPAISILSKMVLCNSFFRNEISCETSIYVLLLRALLLFHSDIALQQDAVITLFLLLYNYYIVGAEKHISIPKILEKIYLPLKCDFHWLDSNFKKNTFFEEIFLDLSKENASSTNNNCMGNTLQILPSLQKDQLNSVPLTRRSEPVYSIAREKQSNENNILLQYIRFSFATAWFSDFDTIYKHVKSKTLNTDMSIDYSIFPGYFNESAKGIVELSDVFDFNRELKLNAEDIRLIKITVPAENLNKFLKKISNATSEKEFLKSLAGLRFTFFLGSHKFLDGNETLKIFHRYLTIKPRSPGDYTIFENTIELYNYFVKAKNENIIKWLLQEISEKNCLLLDILKDYNIPKGIYDVVCELIESLIKYCSTKYDNNKIEELILNENEKGSEKHHYNFYNHLFEYLIPIIEECFHKRYLNQVRSILNIIQILTKTKYIEVDFELAKIVIKKLMYFILALKLFNQTGSHINKNCLLIVGNLMHFIDELDFDENHIKLLSGLCSHDDFDVRALSWCILTKVAAHLKGAHLIIKELSYLPGGFHACCMSTLLDTNEVPIVRSVAGMLFANLLSHRINDTNGVSLHLSVAPLCVELEPSQQNNGLHLVKQIFNKHHFYSAILNSIDYIHIGKSVDCLRIQNITTPNIVSAFCRILSNFICFYSDSSIEEFVNEPFLFRLIGLIKIIPSCITIESLSMMSEICFLINKLHSFDNVISIRKNLCSDYGFLVAFIQLIDLKYFVNENVDLLGNVLQTLKLLINETLSFEIICEILSSNGALNIIQVINFCLNIKKNSDLQNISLTLLIALLVKSDNVCTDKYKTIPIIFDSTNLSIKENEISNGSEEIFNNVRSIFNQIFQKKKLGVLLKKTLICETLAMLLKTSQKVRKIAQKEQFLLTVLESISLIFENITVTCTEYIRKYGDSKKDTIIQELTILYSIILHWFCSDCLTNDSEIEKLSKVALQTWQWINHSETLRDIFLKTLAVVSENSFQVCKQFATSITSFSNSIMQLTSKMVIAETNKIKHPNIDFGILELGLGILTNCCCCIEGRLLLVKMNLLDIIGNLYPIDMKVQKSWNVVTLYWLEFWNIFSRYEQGAVLKHLYILCSLIAKSKNKIRILCLKILRNMAYTQVNRAGLLSSQDFQYTVKEVLEKGNEQEKFIVIITLWKLCAENFKAKHTIKNWGVLNKLKNIQNEIDQNDRENNLNCAIEIVFNILK